MACVLYFDFFFCAVTKFLVALLNFNLSIIVPIEKEGFRAFCILDWFVKPDSLSAFAFASPLPYIFSLNV